MTSYRRENAVASPQAAAPDPAANLLPARLRGRRQAGPPRGTGEVVSPSASVFPDRLLLTLAAPPSINHQYATVNGRRILSAVGRAYKHAVSRDILVALTGSPHREEFLRTARTHPLALSIRFYFTSPLRRDVDGGLKIAQDALCEALGINDNRVREIHLFKAQDTARPRIEVLLSPSP